MTLNCDYCHREITGHRFIYSSHRPHLYHVFYYLPRLHQGQVIDSLSSCKSLGGIEYDRSNIGAPHLLLSCFCSLLRE